jgi:hypothetical protein
VITAVMLSTVAASNPPTRRPTRRAARPGRAAQADVGSDLGKHPSRLQDQLWSGATFHKITNSGQTDTRL